MYTNSFIVFTFGQHNFLWGIALRRSSECCLVLPNHIASYCLLTWLVADYRVHSFFPCHGISLCSFLSVFIFPVGIVCFSALFVIVIPGVDNLLGA
jgi:hypothetical protein